MNAQELKGNEFLTLSFNEQEQLIKNCLVHSASMIDTKTKKETDSENIDKGFDKAFVNGLKESAFSLVNDSDVIQSAWMYTLESANKAESADISLLYLVCVATSKALSKAVYGDIKRNNTDSIDTENPINVYFDNVESKVLNEIERTEIFDLLPSKTKVQIITCLDLMEYGYKVSEIVDYFDITEDTFSQWMSAVINAIAVHKADNKEFKYAQKLLNSKRAKRNKVAFKNAQKAVYDMLNGLESYQTNTKKNKALNEWLNMDYMARIKFITYHKDDFKTIFNLK